MTRKALKLKFFRSFQFIYQMYTHIHICIYANPLLPISIFLWLGAGVYKQFFITSLCVCVCINHFYTLNSFFLSPLFALTFIRFVAYIYICYFCVFFSVSFVKQSHQKFKVVIKVWVCLYICNKAIKKSNEPSPLKTTTGSRTTIAVAAATTAMMVEIKKKIPKRLQMSNHDKNERSIQ